MPIETRRMVGKSDAAGEKNWPRLFEQIFRVDEWSVYRGYAAMRIGSGLK
jgi:hypothetical protein